MRIIITCKGAAKLASQNATPMQLIPQAEEIYVPTNIVTTENYK